MRSRAQYVPKPCFHTPGHHHNKLPLELEASMAPESQIREPVLGSSRRVPVKDSAGPLMSSTAH